MSVTKIERRTQKLSLGAAALSAVAASACCLGPLLLAALGVGGAGAVAAFSAYRPYFLALTAALLMVGFYFAYRKPRQVDGADGCGCESSKAKGVRRAGLWTAAVVVLVVAMAPPLLARLSSSPAAPSGSSGQLLAQVNLPIQGVDCEACAAPIRAALRKVGGLRDLRLDIAHQSATLTYEPAPGRLAAYVTAINELGYEAALPAGIETGR